MRFHFKKAALILSPFILICVVQIHFIPFRTHNVKNDSGDSTIHQWRTTLAKKQKTGNHRNSNSKKVIYRQPLNQRCQIPNLDPFHPDVMSFVSKSHMPPCRLKKYGRVDGRTLHLKIEGVRVQKVTLKYIIRSGDFSVRYSGPHTIVAHRDNDTIGRHCWEECGSKGGSCSFCGKNGYCCRQKFADCSLELQALTELDYHSCVSLDNDDQEGLEGIDIQHQLTDSYFVLEMIINGKPYREFHVAFHKVPEKATKNIEKPNILILMLDSLAAATAERQLKRTYKMLKSDNKTFIFKGHSIVGDGTTAQLCAMLTGIAEDKLPEARRGMGGSSTVDRWPFIFKDLHKLGYHTLWSEDQPSFNAFQYRLHGFKDNPTDYYVRPFWMSAENWLDMSGEACSFTATLDILHRFNKNYRNFNTFAMATVGGVSHNSLNSVGVADNELVDFYELLRRDGILKDTVVILFGDHGLRAGKLRSTVQGKLEERLPFIALTLPDNFASKQNSPLLNNLIDNTHLLTSHFDTYATLQHLVNWPKTGKTGKYGRSLFTNIKKLNRTCSDAGVEPHWCSCLDFEVVNVTTDRAVSKVVIEAIDNINKMLEKEAEGMCTPLNLSHIIRAGRRKPNTDVIEFASTKRDGRCDSCGVVKDTNTNIRYSYEINFQVSPSGGNFEISRDVLSFKDGTFKITNSKNKKYSRTNIYGNAPNCLSKSQRHVEKYCFCKGFSYDPKN